MALSAGKLYTENVSKLVQHHVCSAVALKMVKGIKVCKE